MRLDIDYDGPAVYSAIIPSSSFVVFTAKHVRIVIIIFKQWWWTRRQRLERKRETWVGVSPCGCRIAVSAAVFSWSGHKFKALSCLLRGRCSCHFLASQHQPKSAEKKHQIRKEKQSVDRLFYLQSSLSKWLDLNRPALMCVVVVDIVDGFGSEPDEWTKQNPTATIEVKKLAKQTVRTLAN